MITVIFEVMPCAGHKQQYLDIAAELKPMLEKVEGFISVERFQSLSNPDKILSVSFWKDEAAVERWRILAGHRDAQSKGRSEVFRDYRIRVAQVLRDYGMTERSEVPDESKAAHDGVAIQ